MIRRYVPAFSSILGFLLLAPLSEAQGNLGPITVGAGLQTSFTNTEPATGNYINQFAVDHARIYISGPVVKDISFMFNTEYDGVTNKIGVLDAVAQINVAPEFHIWAGRFLPPSDRANLYGPFYAHEWAVYTDGIQDGYPFVFQGRDNGVMYWGDFGKIVKVSAGAFDGASATGNPTFWGPLASSSISGIQEDGYYLNGTYYGDKNLLCHRRSHAVSRRPHSVHLDFLLEKKLPNGGVVSDRKRVFQLQPAGRVPGSVCQEPGRLRAGSYLFPKVVGIGKFEILGKYAKAEFTLGPTPSYDQKTTEVNFNYVIKQFKARVMSFYKDTQIQQRATNFWQAGVGLQIQM